MPEKSFAPQKGMTEGEIERVVDAILAEATLEEKVAMMSGHDVHRRIMESGGVWGADPYRAGGGCERLDVPPLYFTDGPRGVVRGRSTCFPVTMARGAAWDTELERRVGEVMGIEARAQGCTLSGAVCVNLLRHPAWGRAQETYGEDPFHVGEMGAALAEGIQAHNVVATVKHFALNSIENARFKVDVRVEDRTLREVYLAHFKRIIDAGCASVMSAYNKLNGEHCGQNRTLLTDILRHEWGFAGFVHSDWGFGVYHPYGASAGLDVENPEPVHFGKKLLEAVRDGRIEPAVIDTACRRILSTTFRFACAEDPLESYDEALVACPAHLRVAREAAEKSAVLLVNDGALPLARGADIAVFGRLAAVKNTGDRGSSRVRPPYVVTPLEGLAGFLERPGLAVSGDESDPDAAAKAAASADAAVVVVGYTAEDEGEFIPADTAANLLEALPDDQKKQFESGAFGEMLGSGGKDLGGDRTSLHLHEDQVALIRAVAAANSKTVVVIQAGSAVVISEWSDAPAAILQTFYSGMEGGHALASLLFGEVSPSGKLPFTVARSADDYPAFDKDADQIEYGPCHGYTLLEREHKAPHFAFGHGLSYAVFRYRALKARRARGGIQAEVSLRNDGDRPADEVTQLYIGFPGSAVSRPRKLLRGFRRTTLQPGETRILRFFVPDADLAYWRPQSRDWQLEPGEHTVYAGPSSDDAQLLRVTVVV